MSTSIVSGVDAPPVFEARKHVLDPVALPVEGSIVAMLDAMLGMRWNAGRDAAFNERLAEGRRTVGSIGQHGAGSR